MNAAGHITTLKSFTFLKAGMPSMTSFLSCDVAKACYTRDSFPAVASLVWY